jgi:hypothetical protein
MKQMVEEAAKEHQSKFETCDGEGTLVGFANGMHKQSYESFIAGAEWQAKQSPWVSVEERLPENEDRVLVLCKMKRFNSYFTLLNNYIDGEWETKTLAYYDTIAWMPIPSFDEILEVNKDVLERIKEKED